MLRAAGADCFGGRVVSERGMRLDEKMIEDIKPVLICFLCDPLLDSLDDSVAGKRAAQLVAPLIELVEGFRITHGPSQ